jgi:hypothetical protein
MVRICPNPIPWHHAFQHLTDYAKRHPCTPPSPPAPLILAGWAFSNDVAKMNRWQETLAWAKANGCSEIVEGIADEDFYYVVTPTDYVIGPMGGPMYREWDCTTKTRPSAADLQQYLEILLERWPEVAGPELSRATRPCKFTGVKARRLLIYADSSVQPPWGEWSYLSWYEPDRRTFTTFRGAINKAIAPHEVDHVGCRVVSKLPA